MRPPEFGPHRQPVCPACRSASFLNLVCVGCAAIRSPCQTVLTPVPIRPAHFVQPDRPAAPQPPARLVNSNPGQPPQRQPHASGQFQASLKPLAGGTRGRRGRSCKPRCAQIGRPIPAARPAARPPGFFDEFGSMLPGCLPKRLSPGGEPFSRIRDGAAALIAARTSWRFANHPKSPMG